MNRQSKGEALVRANLRYRGLPKAVRETLAGNSPHSVMMQLAMTRGQARSQVPEVLLPFSEHTVTSRDLQTAIATAGVLRDSYGLIASMFTTDRSLPVFSDEGSRPVQYAAPDVYLNAAAIIGLQAGRAFFRVTEVRAAKPFLDRSGLAARETFIAGKQFDLRDILSQSLLSTGLKLERAEALGSLTSEEAEVILASFNVVSNLAEPLLVIEDQKVKEKSVAMLQVERIAQNCNVDLELAALERASLEIGKAIVTVDSSRRARGFALSATERDSLVSTDPIAQVDAVSVALGQLDRALTVQPPNLGLRAL